MSDASDAGKPGVVTPPAADTPGGPAAKVVPWLTSLSAMVILIFFSALLWKMFDLAKDAEDAHWQRLLFLYNGLEALAFAAAGVLLGERVQRSRAQAAESRANNAEAKAGQAQEQAAEANANGKALKKAVDAKVQSGRALEAGESAPDLAELSVLANRLFPD